MGGNWGRTLAVLALLAITLGTTTAAVAFDRKQDSGEGVDLSSFFFDQIEQKGTDTCLTNALTSLLEVGYYVGTGTFLQMSEPATLALFSSSSADDEEQYALSDVDRLPGVLASSVMPAASYFRNGYTFNDAYSAATQALPQYRNLLVQEPVGLSGTQLFDYGRFQTGHATEADYNAIVQWLVQKHLPVMIFHVNSGFWHVVLAMGYDPETDSLYIHDSLGPAGYKGLWRGMGFINTTYAAFGVSYYRVTNGTWASNASKGLYPLNPQVPAQPIYVAPEP